jgi:hypothetical protein
MVSLSLSKIGESRVDQLDELWRGRSLWPSSGVTEGARRKTFLPAYPLIVSDLLDTSRLMQGTWTYRSARITDDVLTEPEGGDRIRMVRATYAGEPVWVVNAARQFRGEWGGYDTTYLDATSLRPLRSATTVNKGRTRFEQTFSADSGHESLGMTGSMKALYRGAIALPFPGNALFLNHWSTERLAALSPAFRLRRGWRGSMYQVAFISRTGVKGVTPLDLRVVGTDEVTVPAGTFDCWRIEVTNHVWNPQLLRIWVSRDKGWLIKEQHRGGDYVINGMLESYEPTSAEPRDRSTQAGTAPTVQLRADTASP